MRGRQCMLTALSEFFDASTVVPPGDIANANLVDFRQLRQRVQAGIGHKRQRRLSSIKAMSKADVRAVTGGPR